MKALIGERLRVLRATQKYTIEYVAGALHISPAAYSKIENGLSNISIDRLAQIATFFGVSAKELLSEENELQSQAEVENVQRDEILSEISNESKKLHLRMNKIEVMLQIMLKEIRRKRKRED
jgi:transcriptional regulator with XRE-family HTH domain